MKITIRRPDDFHVHFRQGDLLSSVVPYTAQYFGRALAMPNTTPPILAGDKSEVYARVVELAATAANRSFKALTSIKVVQSTRPEWILSASRSGVIAGKVYPVGVTTNAEDGVTDFSKLSAVFQAMMAVDMVACLHGEQPGEFCLDREKLFLPTVEWLVETFPRLRIVLEHVTTREAVELVRRLPDRVAATITAHHLCLTLNDVIGERLRPHNYCLPVAKRPGDRVALLEAVTSGNPKFFFGSDSAPHPIDRKECAEGAAGIFTAPLALPLLAQVFEQCGALDRLEDFVSVFGAGFYDLPLNDGQLTLIKKEMEIPERVAGIVPFMAGKTLGWSVAG